MLSFIATNKGLGLLEHPTWWHIAITVVISLFLIFAISAGTDLPRIILGIFNPKKRLGRRYD
jgi:hypothetical protein